MTKDTKAQWNHRLQHHSASLRVKIIKIEISIFCLILIMNG